MNLLQKRTNSNDDILQGLFIQQQLREEAQDIDQAQTNLMASRGFNSQEFYSDRSYSVSDNKMTYTHLAKHRFVDMKSRNTREGKVKKKSHPIHNRILFGHFNNIIKRMSFGYTQAVKEQMQELANNLKNPKN